MLSGCISSSSLRHCWAFPCGSCHWHRYIRFMACAPHLSFLMLVFSLIIVWIGCPSVDCQSGRRVLEVCALWGGVCCARCGWFVRIVEGWVGNNVETCCRVSLISVGACLYVVWNSFGVSMALVLGFWIYGSVVMPYMYNLFRYFWVLALAFSARLL